MFCSFFLLCACKSLIFTWFTVSWLHLDGFVIWLRHVTLNWRLRSKWYLYAGEKSDTSTPLEEVWLSLPGKESQKCVSLAISHLKGVMKSSCLLLALDVAHVRSFLLCCSSFRFVLQYCACVDVGHASLVAQCSKFLQSLKGVCHPICRNVTHPLAV